MHRVPLARWTLTALLLSPVPALAAQGAAYVVTTDFATGSVSAVALSSRAVTQDVASIHSDARARWHDGLLYVINRFGQDNIQVIDPTQGFVTIRQFSTGTGSNPADIAFISPTKAYVTRYELADILIVNPQTGATLGSIPLGSFADADGIPEMDRMIRVGDRVFVSVQRLNRNAGFTPADSSLIVVIDCQTNTVVDANPVQAGVQGIRLVGTQPFTDWAFDQPTSRLLIGCVGFFGVSDGDIEWIDPVHLTSLGVAATEAALGGDVNDLVWDGPGRSFAIVNDAAFNTSLIAWSVPSAGVTDTLMATSGFGLADAALNDRGELYVAKNDFLAPGLFVLNAANGSTLAGPLDTGLPPFLTVFDENTGVVGVPGLETVAFTAPFPNPASAEVRLSVRLAANTDLRVGVFDLSGRRVRMLFEGAAPAGALPLRWDLRNTNGRRVEAGLYWMAVEGAGARQAQRVIVLP